MKRFSAATLRVARQLDAATKCPTCGKSTLVMSKAVAGVGRGSQPVPVSADTHCACPGGPAAPVQGKTDADWPIFRRGGSQPLAFGAHDDPYSLEPKDK